MPSTYLDPIAYLKQPTGLTLNTYIGDIGRIATCSSGATSLTVTSALNGVALSQYDSFYVFDGPNSEQLQVGSGGAAIGATSIPLQSATAYAHTSGTVYCTDGTAGSLGEQIFTASKWIEDEICYQALWSTAYTNEILTMPTMRAAIDNEANIHFRPRHFPISALTSISIQDRRKQLFPMDATQATVDSDQQTVDISLAALLSSQSQSQQGYPWVNSIRRGTTAWIILAYTAGFAVGALPKLVERACGLLTSECFQQLENPIGADTIQQNKRNVTFMLRGDTSGESLLVKQATKLLGPYITQSF